MFYLLNTKARLFQAICLGVAVCFLLTGIMPSQAFAQHLGASPALNTAPLSPAFTPTLVRGIRVYPDNPFTFDFIVDSGDTGLTGDALKKESEKLVRYFLASLTIPENNLWVNLSPHEKDRIVPDALGATEMGHDMLAQDYLLKQITASLTNPDSDLGKEFWAKVYKKSYEEFGTTNIPVDTFNKVWIMPARAEVYENGDKAFVVESRLKVMLEEDYVALQAKQQVDSREHIVSSEKPLLNTNDQMLTTRNTSTSTSTLSSQIVREVFIPVLEKEVNEGKNFAQLRQIYDVIILGYWYKTKLKNSILNQVYANQQKVKGIDLSGKAQTQEVYEQYLDTFKKGVCNMMKVEYDPYAKKSIPRKYFAGGVTTANVGEVFESGQDPSACSPLIKKIKVATIVLMTVGLSVFGVNGFAQTPDTLRLGQPAEKTVPLPAELEGESQEAISDSLEIDLPNEIKEMDEKEIKNGKQFEKFKPGKLRPQLRKEIYRFPEPTEYFVPNVLAQSPAEQKPVRASSSLFQIGNEYGPSGHKIAGGMSTGRGGVNSREIIAVDWQKDKVLREVYRRIEEKLDPSKMGKDTIPFKVDYLESVYDAIHAAVQYDLSAFADKKGQEVLIGDTLEEGGVCRHMGIFVAALLEKLVQDGWLRGKVYYVRGIDHGWAAYQTKSGVFRVFDVAQDHFGDPQKKYFSGKGYAETYQEAFNKVVAREQSVILRSQQLNIDYIAPLVVNLANKLSLWVQKVEDMDVGDPARSKINPAVGFVITDRKGGLKALRDGESVLLGRESYENRFSGLKDSLVSRKHVAITRQGSEIAIQDVSANGTTVSFPTASSGIQAQALKDNAQDISQVLALDGAFFPRNHRLKESDLKDYLADPHVKVLVAKEGGDVIAFAIYWVDNLNPEAVHLSRIVVDKKKRGEGVGSQIMDQIIEESKLKGGKTITYIPFNEDSYAWFRGYASKNKIKIDSLGNLGERLTLDAPQENVQRSEGFIDRPRSDAEREEHEEFALEGFSWIIEERSSNIRRALEDALKALNVNASPDVLLGKLKANYLYGAGVYKDVFRFMFNSDLNQQFIVKINRQKGQPLYQEGESELHRDLARTNPGEVSKIAGIFYIELLRGDIPGRMFLSEPSPELRVDDYITLSLEEFIPGKTIGQTKDIENNIPEQNRARSIKTLVNVFLSYNKGKISGYVGPSDFHDNNLVLEAKTEEAVLVDVGARMPYRTISDYLLVVLRYYGYFGTRKSGNALDVLYEKEIVEKLPSGRHWDEILDKTKRRAENLMREYQEYQGNKDLLIEAAGHDFTWDQLKNIADFLDGYLKERQKVSVGPSSVSSSSVAVKPTADELQQALDGIKRQEFFNRSEGFLARLQDLDPRDENKNWSEESAEALGNDLYAFAQEIRRTLDSNPAWRFLYNTLNVGGPFAEKLDVINPLAGVSMTLRNPDKDFVAENFDIMQDSLKKVRSVFQALNENTYTLEDVKFWNETNGFYLDVFRQGPASSAVENKIRALEEWKPVPIFVGENEYELIATTTADDDRSWQFRFFDREHKEYSSHVCSFTLYEMEHWLKGQGIQKRILFDKFRFGFDGLYWGKDLDDVAMHDARTNVEANLRTIFRKYFDPVGAGDEKFINVEKAQREDLSQMNIEDQVLYWLNKQQVVQAGDLVEGEVSVEAGAPLADFLSIDEAVNAFSLRLPGSEEIYLLPRGEKLTYARALKDEEVEVDLDEFINLLVFGKKEGREGYDPMLIVNYIYEPGAEYFIDGKEALEFIVRFGDLRAVGSRILDAEMLRGDAERDIIPSEDEQLILGAQEFFYEHAINRATGVWWSVEDIEKEDEDLYELLGRPLFSPSLNFQLQIKDGPAASSTLFSPENVQGADQLGGIDFNAENMNMTTRGKGVDLLLPALGTSVGPMDIQGLMPVILNVVPVADFMGLLGLSQEEQKALKAQLSQSDSSSDEDNTSQDPNISEIAFHSQEKILALR